MSGRSVGVGDGVVVAQSDGHVAIGRVQRLATRGCPFTTRISPFTGCARLVLLADASLAVLLSLAPSIRPLVQPRQARPYSARAIVLFGFVSPVILYAVTMSVRLGFGAVTAKYLLGDFVVTIPSMLLVFGCMMRSMRRSVRRRHSTLRTLVYAFLWSAAAMAICNTCRFVLRSKLPSAFPSDPTEPLSIAFALSSAITDSLPLMTIWSGLFMLPLALRRAARQQIQTAAARRDAELLRLRAHLEPHFVLNTLNTIAGLVTDEPVEARRLIGLLGDLFRDATQNRDDDLHTLREEIDWLERYAAIHKARHGRMISFTWLVAPNAEGALVPRLVLQPILENAVLHGALRRREGGTVRVGARIAADGNVVCDVEDDGPGFVEPRRKGARGMAIVERRLALVSPRAALTVAREDGTTRVRITLPNWVKT